MQIELDEKINAMDRLYGQMENLFHCYVKWRTEDWTKKGREECKWALQSLRECGCESDVFPEDVANNLGYVFDKEERPEILLSIEDILSQLLQNVKKMYLACMHDEGSYHKVLLENYYNTAYDKNALLFYLVYPFLFPDVSAGHTNQQEVRILAALLRDRGYNVDLANTRYTGTVDLTKYSLVIGSGRCFEQICGQAGEDTLKICYLTESSPYFANPAEARRLADFRKRNRHSLPYERQSANFLDLRVLSFADAAICIGNAQTVSTYEGMFQRIFPINATGFSGGFLLDQNGKETGSGKHFLWYGGAGPVHKGLDLCLEAFRMLPDLYLHIVGEIPSDFYEFYRKDIEEGENIFYYGFLGKDADEFCMVCRQCGFCISPSCSEGQSTSVITAMLAGMVPVCTPETGLDMAPYGGFLIENTKIEALIGFIAALAKIDEKDLWRRQQKAYQCALSNHSLEHYKEQLNVIFDKINL